MLLLFTQAATDEVDVSDTASLALTEASANALSSEVSDTSSLTLTEASANALTSAVSDDTALALTEASESSVASARTDTADLAADDASSLETFEALEVTDDSALSVDDASQLVASEAAVPGWRADSGYTTDLDYITADGFVGQAPAQAVVEVFGGGFFVAYEREQARRERERRQRLDAEDEAREIQDAIDRQIALLLREQEARDAERDELERLSSLVTHFADQQAQDAFTERVAHAYVRAFSQQSASALMAFDREFRRQLEEEDFAVLMTLAMDD